MSLKRRQEQGKALVRWLWTGLTGSADEVRELGTEAYEDVRRQVTDARPRRMLNEGHTIEPPDDEARRR